MSDALLERVALPQGRRLRGGILDKADALPEGWELGIRFRTTGCVPPEVLGICEVGDPTDVRPSSAEFKPAFIRQNSVCALMSQVGTTDLALNRLEATTEWGLGRMLADGTGTENPSLADATVIHGGASLNLPGEVILAVSCLEQAVADTGYGAAAVLHAPYRAAAWLASTRLIDEDGFSPTGLQWIISPGYPTEEEVVTIWATGPVWASVEGMYVLRDPQTGQRPVDWLTNTDAAYTQRLGLAAFDPCLNLAANFAVPACTGES